VRSLRLNRQSVSFHTAATRTTASVFGAFAGFLGIEHGIFEALQGDSPVRGVLINAIDPRVSGPFHGSEPALTILPSYLLSGIFAMAIGTMVVVVSMAFIRSRPGPSALMILSLGQFVAGGGVAPLFLAIPAALVATRIGKPLGWWRRRLPSSARAALAGIWPFALFCWLVIVNTQLLIALLVKRSLLTALLPPLMFALLLLTIISGVAFDIREQDKADRHA
jgi:hypothetical protein